ncbi:hypothetical protein H8356DRAFT_1423700 [Neocallimastix lanati (nom. inval.)]|nr:hypothetical protein H8356DRAFT_1423700 [Neocallimastix sp. JGI-2020a]
MISQLWKHFINITSMTFNDIGLDLINYLMVIWKGAEIDDMTTRNLSDNTNTWYGNHEGLKNRDILQTFKYILYSRLKELSKWMTAPSEVAAFCRDQPHLGISDVRNYSLEKEPLNYSHNSITRNKYIVNHFLEPRIQSSKKKLSCFTLFGLQTSSFLENSTGTKPLEPRKEDTNRNSNIIGVEPEELIETESSEFTIGSLFNHSHS